MLGRYEEARRVLLSSLRLARDTKLRNDVFYLVLTSGGSGPYSNLVWPPS